MTEKNDWLDRALDRLPKEAAPDGFQIRLKARILAEQRVRRAWRPWPLLAAAAFLLLATGYWLGMGAPALDRPTQVGTGGDVALLEVSEIYSHREVLEAWEILQDPDLELGFDDTIAGAWAYGLSDGDEETSPR